MAWVRYDDQFYGHPKVTAVIAEDPGAIALHVLANTWTNSQKRPGYIPAHQPGVLVCDRSLGTKWAQVLVHATLWHERGQECEECLEEYADLPTDAMGYVIHNARTYRAPARERQTPGTPTELSEKRRAAGSKGGTSTSKRREQMQQDARANAAETESKASKPPSNSVSPEPVPEPVVASTEATTPEASLPSAPKARRGTRLPEDFAVTPEMRKWAEENVPQLAGARETEKFVNHFRSAPGQKGVKLDWVATWRNWMLTAAERLPRGPNGHKPYTNPTDPDAYRKGL